MFNSSYEGIFGLPSSVRFNARILIPLAIFTSAFSTRLISLISKGGYLRVLGYDDGVYYSAANGFIHGQIPYRDFILVHPPGILILLSPFAFIGKLFGDHAGLIAARTSFMILGSFTAVLIYLVAKRISTKAGFIAGITYAFWYPAIVVERTSYLEAIGIFGVAFTLFLLQRETPTNKHYLLAGSVMGLATATKLWFVLPIIVIGVWLLLIRKFRGVLNFVAASALTFLSICGYFWVKSGSKFLHLIIFAQLNRSNATYSHISRLKAIFNLESFESIKVVSKSIVVLAILTILLSGLLIWRKCGAKIVILWIILFTAQLSVILTTPTFFQSYSSYVACSFALLVGALGHSILEFIRFRKMQRILYYLLIIVVTLFGWHGIANETNEGRPPLTFLKDVVSNQRCVAVDSPIILAITNTLTRDFNNNCTLIYDVNGTIYGVKEPPGSRYLTATQRRKRSNEYQQDLINYFEKSDLFILKRISADGLAKKTRISLAHKRMIERFKDYVVYLPER